MSVSKEAAEMVKDTKKTVAKEAQSQAEEARDRVAAHGEAMSNAAEKAADEFDGVDPVQNFLNEAGDAVRGATSHLKERSIPDLVDDVSAFARRNPLLFLGGAALAGFAAARFLSARSPEQDDSASSDDVWTGHIESQPTAEALK